MKTKELSDAEIEYLHNKVVLKNKEKYSKKSIQKAQQGIDNYLSTIKN